MQRELSVGEVGSLHYRDGLSLTRQRASCSNSLVWVCLAALPVSESNCSRSLHVFVCCGGLEDKPKKQRKKERNSIRLRIFKLDRLRG